MRAHTTTKPFVYPSVRAIATPTAHPASEAWPIAIAPRGPLRARVEDAASRFGRLQARLKPAAAAALTGRERSLIVVPSWASDKKDEPAAKTQAFEERLLCSLLELQDPHVRMTYVTSSPITPAIVDYYMSLLPARSRRDARSRLTLVALGERSGRALSEKLLDRPDVLDRIRRSVADERPCWLIPYSTTPLEQEVALALDIPLYGADPRHSHLGTKSGCRELFARAGVPHPAGVEGVEGVTAAVEAIVQLRRARPKLATAIMKLDDGVSGDGNAVVDLSGLPEPGAADERALVASRVACVAPGACDLSAAAYLSRFDRTRGIVEEWISGAEIRSPSVQMQVAPSGELELVSTHEQILGGPRGQTYLGCRFPAAPSYAREISRLARRVGEHLANGGVIGRFAIDFVVAGDGHGKWTPFAIELNLRRGGTTHPYETLASLTGGRYDPESGTFVSRTGEEKYYVATDRLEAPQLRALGHVGLLALAAGRDLRFNAMMRTGAVFHMLSSVDELGRVGFTAIGNTRDEAGALYQHVRTTVLARAQAVVDSRRSTRQSSRSQLSSAALTVSGASWLTQ